MKIGNMELNSCIGCPAHGWNDMDILSGQIIHLCRFGITIPDPTRIPSECPLAKLVKGYDELLRENGKLADAYAYGTNPYEDDEDKA